MLSWGVEMSASACSPLPGRSVSLPGLSVCLGIWVMAEKPQVPTQWKKLSDSVNSSRMAWNSRCAAVVSWCPARVGILGSGGELLPLRSLQRSWVSLFLWPQGSQLLDGGLSLCWSGHSLWGIWSVLFWMSTFLFLISFWVWEPRLVVL